MCIKFSALILSYLSRMKFFTVQMMINFLMYPRIEKTVLEEMSFLM